MLIKQVTPYLYFNGTCEDAMAFYSEALDGSVRESQTYGDAGIDAAQDSKRILHAQLEVDGQLFMFSDIPNDDDSLNKSHNIYIVLEFESEDKLKEVYNIFKEDGQVKMELQEMFWNQTYAKVIDKFGIGWDLCYTHQE
ncbi:VOC family protein [Mammaliicoccus stepanovicii]|uniref:3-demethylubiquinone-9 3-methyltransferase n=1 Tax=Mammaliicoccus stepanovicii TaxID=643214 RepID=A0A239ZBM6_9STAP|nr:VOC family protein [Mammaliicoccus stepanovicii]GGI42072.1 VOC family protein [Mammaliicoccus stepanovicii]SNV68562.1 3-demethylubiquinone-9 3-methyltransferase [Mammaliicoccus stepanovicii]